VVVQTINVLQFTIKNREFIGESIVIDGQDLSLKNESQYGNGLLRFQRKSATQWEVSLTFVVLNIALTGLQCIHFSDDAADIQPSGRLSLILSSAAPILLVIPQSSDSSSNIQLLYALRISHDLNVYYKLETEIIFDSDAMHRYEEGTLGSANIVVIDGPQKTSFGKWLLLQNKSDLRINDAGFLSLDGFNLSAPSTGNFSTLHSIWSSHIAQGLCFYILILQALVATFCSCELRMKVAWKLSSGCFLREQDWQLLISL
jgi:hypothetical protein